MLHQLLKVHLFTYSFFSSLEGLCDRPGLNLYCLLFSQVRAMSPVFPTTPFYVTAFVKIVVQNPS